MVMFMASRNRKMSSSSSADTTGSRPAEGSSKNISLGSMTIARATAARLIIPPESWAGIMCSNPPRLTTSSFMRAMICMVFRSSRVCSSRGSWTFSPTLMELSSAPPWKATPMFFRSSCISRGLSLVMSFPSM